jgi:hypothetical protein
MEVVVMSLHRAVLAAAILFFATLVPAAERPRAAPAAVPYVQDMWWSGTRENGWGVSIVQRADRLFAVIYAYNDAGNPVWYVMPAGQWDAERKTISGPLYSPRGTPFFSYDASRLRVGSPVGTATLTFSGKEQGILGYTINGVMRNKSIVRQPLSPPSTSRIANPVDMWWGGEEEIGWGLAISQQDATLFSIWLTYDLTGAATWYVLPGGRADDANIYEGRIYRTTGTPWAAHEFDSARLQVSDVGSFRMRFNADGVAATLDYAIDGRTGRFSLVRQPL